MYKGLEDDWLGGGRPCGLSCDVTHFNCPTFVSRFPVSGKK